MRRLNTALIIFLLMMKGLFGQHSQTSNLRNTLWSDVKEKVYPMMKQTLNPDNYTSPLVLKESDQPIIDSYVADLQIYYLIDNGSSFTYINSGDLKQWNIDKDSLNNTALENLERLANGQAQVHGDSTYAMIVLNGNLEASLMLLDGFWESVAQVVKHKNLVIGIPARDVLLVTHLEYSEGINKLRQAINQVYKQGDHLITKWIFKRENGTWSKYELVE